MQCPLCGSRVHYEGLNHVECVGAAQPEREEWVRATLVHVPEKPACANYKPEPQVAPVATASKHYLEEPAQTHTARLPAPVTLTGTPAVVKYGAAARSAKINEAMIGIGAIDFAAMVHAGLAVGDRVAVVKPWFGVDLEVIHVSWLACEVVLRTICPTPGTVTAFPKLHSGDVLSFVSDPANAPQRIGSAMPSGYINHFPTP